jgi:hypothetical protein
MGVALLRDIIGVSEGCYWRQETSPNFPGLRRITFQRPCRTQQSLGTVQTQPEIVAPSYV